MSDRPRRRGLVHGFSPKFEGGGGGGHKEDVIWLISLSDLMTNLMLFFLIMYAMTRMPESERAKMLKEMSKSLSGEKPVPGGEQVPQPGEAQRVKEKEIADALKKLLDTQETEVVLSEKLIRIRMSSPVCFASGSDVLTRQGRKDMEPIRQMLQGLSNAVIIEGFTDNVPIIGGKFKTNWELSAARASSVRRFLSAEPDGLPESRIVIAAYGEYKPVASNATRAGRQMNRRIEITVVRR